MAPKTNGNANSAKSAKTKAPSTPNPKSKAKRSPSSSVPLVLSAVVVIVAFLGGILTPPAMELARELMADMPVSEVASNTSATPNNLPHVPCTPNNLDNYLHATPVKGLHVICVESLKLDADGNELAPSTEITSHQRRLEGSNSLRLTFYKMSHPGRLKRRVTVNGANSVGDVKWMDLYRRILTELGLKRSGATRQPWAIFSALGERIVGENDVINTPESNDEVLKQLASSEMVILTEGGNWIWPGVVEGFRRTVEVTSPNTKEPLTVTIETLSLVPLVVSIEGFLTEDECDYIAEKAGPRMQYSGVSLMDKDKGKAASEWRTSQTAFLGSTDDPTLTDIDHRVASLTRIPRNHQEQVQVLRYGATEKYDAHHDFFNPALYRSDPNTLRLIDNGKRNRYATVFWYLTDVDVGGETIFPRYGGAPQPYDHSSCAVGLKVKPQKGKVIIFYSLDAAGDLDDYSLHGACPVGEGYVKWAANKWIWNAPMHFIRD